LFLFFKSKPFLKDLIPTNYVDIHSHLLPGIDDGAKTIVETLSLTTEMVKMGFGQAVTTPHVMSSVWENTRREIEELQVSTSKTIKESLPNFSCKAAAEYFLDSNFHRLLQTEPLLTIKDNYVLIEMSYIAPPIQIFEILFDMQVAGYVPVLAHPERYTYYHSDSSHYRKLKNAGCKFQMNLLSVVGYYGKTVAESAARLLRDGLIDFVGSDIHHRHHTKAFSKRVMVKDTTPLENAFGNNSTFSF
jgi:tyrosine-protein phosphatase YwqE